MAGKPGLAGLNSLDIVVIMLLSTVVQNAIIGDDLNVFGATTCACPGRRSARSPSWR